MSTPHYHVLCPLPGADQITRVVSERSEADRIALEFNGTVRECFNPFHLPRPAGAPLPGHAVRFLCTNRDCASYLEDYDARCRITEGHPSGALGLEPVAKDSDACPECGGTGEPIDAEADLRAKVAEASRD
ncbi:MAG: hypothetical protein ACHQ1G_07605 [Planctomycetota bacterium]